MPKIIDHQSHRQDLLRQCLSLFAEHGFKTLTMRQIASSLGVSTGTLYHYFPNKESIFVQLVEEFCEKDIDAFFAQAPVEASLEEKLRQIMAFFLQQYSSYQQQMLIWIDFYQYSQQSGEPAVDVLQQFWVTTHQRLSQYLRLPAEQIDCFLTYIDGLLLQCLYGRDEVAIAQQAEVFITLLGNTLSAE
jgi:AcrR family transcriptional regulator